RCYRDWSSDVCSSDLIGAPNSAASYLGMLMAMAVGVLLAKVGRMDKYLAAAALAMGTIPLIFTLSRGGWLGFLVSLATIAVFGRSEERRVGAEGRSIL